MDNDIYRLADSFSWSKSETLTAPCCGRSGHAVAFNVSEKMLFITGGTNATSTLDTYARRIGELFVKLRKDFLLFHI